MFGLSILFTSTENNSYETEEHSLVVLGFEELISECNEIRTDLDWNDYVLSLNNFIDEYGEPNTQRLMEITTENREISRLIDKLNQCENKKDLEVDNYMQEHGLI